MMTPQESFEALYREHFKSMYSFAFKLLHQREDALEVTQEAFLELYTKIDKGQLEEIEHVIKWLYGVTRNKANAHFSRGAKNPIIASHNLQEGVLSQESTERELQRQEVRRWVETQLDQENFQLLLLSLKGFKIKELSEQFGLGELVIKKRLQRTREKTLVYFRQQENTETSDEKIA